MAQTFNMIAKYGQPKEEPEWTTPTNTKQPVQDKAIEHRTRCKETLGPYRGPKQIFNKRVWDSYRLIKISLNQKFDLVK
jgi:hypothetical protein